jgi:hypothetical protein
MFLRFALFAGGAMLMARTAAAAGPEFLDALYKLDAGLIGVQNSAGALVCPSKNPDQNKLHSRAGEGVYPLAVAFKHSQDAKYSDAAIKLGNWLITTQDGAGFWSEDWPDAGWNGTTADQLISLAGAYTMLKGKLSAGDDTKWKASITKSANWIAANFPMGNINYQPTGAVALIFAENAIGGTNATWENKAKSLMGLVVGGINSDKLITGEGKGIDLGYNIAQSIGYITLYGLLTKNNTYVDQGVQTLTSHSRFMYPNGAMDNSWGTRSYKWMLESGSKTAPGIEFTFALLADKNPKFNRAAQLAVKFLTDNFIDADNHVVYGPHAIKHATSNPPCIYPTFARAQSLALAVEYGPDVSASEPIFAETKNWSLYYPTAKTGMIRTDKIMATVTAYDGIDQYGRGSVARGGSLTNVWFEGYGPLGFLQTSSQTDYNRQEPRHMPDEGSGLLPLTSRIESGTNRNLYDENATLAIAAEAGGYKATASGALKSSAGAASGVTFTWIHHFAATSYTQEVTVSNSNNVQIVEPFVNNPGNTYALAGDSAFRITTKEGGVWELRVLSSTTGFTLAAGENAARYWCPFPGLEAYPLTLKLASKAGAQTIKYSIGQVTASGVLPGAEHAYADVHFRVSADRRIVLNYDLAHPGRVKVSLSSVDGKKIADLATGASARSGALEYDAGRLPPGIYFFHLEVDGKSSLKKTFTIF